MERIAKIKGTIHVPIKDGETAYDAVNSALSDRISFGQFNIKVINEDGDKINEDPFTGKKTKNNTENRYDELIRCKDCKYFSFRDYYLDEVGGPPMPAVTDCPTCCKWGNGGCRTNPNGFCFLAERRKDK